MSQEVSLINNEVMVIYYTSIDPCRLSPEVGPCKGAFPRWFYNISSGQCEIFAYGGCKGNENRFQSLNECFDNCRKS